MQHSDRIVSGLLCRRRRWLGSNLVTPVATLHQTPAHITTIMRLQNVDGAAESGGFCRDEFQSFSKYFASPLIQQAIRKRYEKGSSELVTADQTFCDVVDSWRAKLDGAFDCMLPGTTLVRDVGGAWSASKHVPVSAYKTTTDEANNVMPYFVTLDRSTAQNFWVKAKKQHLEHPGFPVLQVIKMPPRGHDLHQIVEHAIGCIKSHVARVLGDARRMNRYLSTKMAADAVQAGCRKYTAEAWSKNLNRLLECLEVVAADRGQIIRFERIDRWGNMYEVIVRGTGGGYCPLRWS